MNSAPTVRADVTSRALDTAHQMAQAILRQDLPGLLGLDVSAHAAPHRKWSITIWTAPDNTDEAADLVRALFTREGVPVMSRQEVEVPSGVVIVFRLPRGTVRLSPYGGES